MLSSKTRTTSEYTSLNNGISNAITVSGINPAKMATTIFPHIKRFFIREE